jgi:tetratricopeptide (TPR) repeat protein
MNQQAVDWYKRAVDALNAHQWSQALRLAQRSLQWVPEHAGVNFVAGVALLELKQIPAALTHLRRATALNPQRADYAVQMARVLIMARAFREARHYADKAMALGIDDAHTLDTIGVVYTRVNEHEKALEAFSAAVQRFPGEATFRYNYGTSLLFSGRIDEAEVEYRACIRLAPRYWRAYASLSQLKRWGPQENNLEVLEDARQLAGHDPDGVLYVNMAMAKELEDIGRFPEAFRSFGRAKAPQKTIRRYESSRDVALFEAIERTFGEVGMDVAGDESNEPIFVVGMPRSGTTLVDRILSSHPDVHSAGELQNFPMMVKRLSGTTTPFVTDVPTLTNLRGLDWGALGKMYIESTRPGTGQRPRFVDKLPHNFLYVGHIARALPRARIVCLRRNPMDTCLSNYRQLFALSSPAYDYSFDLLDTGRYYLMFDRLMEYWRTALRGRFLELRYEDLVEHQEQKSRELLDFCGLEWHDACLHFERNSAPVATASVVQVRSPVTRDYMGRWLRYGSDLDALRELLGPRGDAW